MSLPSQPSQAEAKDAGVDLTIEIPVYGPPVVLPGLVERLAGVAGQLGLRWEVVLVDDASPYGAWEVIQSLHERYPGQVQAVQLMRNFGQHNALMCGLRFARGQLIVTMDDDGQHPPEEIPKLLNTLQQTGADVVYGVPERRRHPWWRNLGAWLVIRFFQWALQTRVTPSAFRLMRRPVAEAILRYPYHFTHLDGLILWNTTRVAEVEVEHRPRQQGRSGYSFRKLATLALNVFTNFSLLPLQVASVLGLVAAAGGLLLGLMYLGLWLAGQIAVPGYASTIVAILVLGGLQLLALGILGEYLGRVHLNLNQRPQYTIRHVLPSGLPAQPATQDHPRPANLSASRPLPPRGEAVNVIPAQAGTQTPPRPPAGEGGIAEGNAG
ncbi:MAG: glycosyltransferase family 2 protein [Thermoguttaceae bacterium]|nr:glycosyltransferase family 2 protein [Thermoguttaceae bacterium]MDW8037821.1 glycosyltransferase family 2 protein [Thermoguttaceae bacterium]